MEEKKHVVLVVDDEVAVRNALVRTLRKEPWRVLVAASAREGLSILGETKVDLVISDHRMPEMTGLDFLKRVRAEYPDTVRIMLTGQADMDTVIAAINEGEIYRFITKPWNDEDLRITLRIALSQLDLERENRRLLSELKKHDSFLARLEKAHPGLFEVKRDERGAIVIDEEDLGDL